jgi:hypothetical protein
LSDGSPVIGRFSLTVARGFLAALHVAVAVVALVTSAPE